MSTSFDPERWARLERLFHEARDLDPEALAAFIEREVAGDKEMRVELRGLLEEEDAELHVEVRGADVLSATGAAQVPERVGAYRIDRELGRGGMGVVYLGVREQGDFEHRVAIKMLPAATYDPAMLWRFQNERQILASLQHPGIARLLDGGTTESGVPYVVMDFVDGAPIDAYCDETGLDLDERIELFLRVCNAVSYAHTKLVAHRDIKPSNILVDANGVPKLLDFGIAKLVDSQAAAADVTATRIMTLSFASPEQIAGEPVGTGADVYALGTLLYLLLTGQRPHGKEGLSSTELARRIVTDDPIAPSVASGDPRLRGDLDTIIGKALLRPVDKRYASVDALIHDLVAYRHSQPISARPPTFGYRASRFFRRNRAASVAGVLAGAALIVGSLGLAVGLTRARTAEAAALEEAQVASQVTNFLVEMFDMVGADSIDAAHVTARDLLDRGRERVDRELADQPEILVRLKEAIGNGYHGLQQTTTARMMFEGVLSSLDPGNPRTPIVQTKLGVANRYAENSAAAKPVLDEAIERLAVLVDTTSTESMRETPELSRSRGSALSERGMIASIEADWGTAEELTARGFRLTERLEGPDAQPTARTALAAASVLALQRRTDEAMPLQQRAVDILRRTLPADDPNRLQGEGFLAMLYAQAGLADSAQALMEDLIPRQRERLGDHHPNVMQSLQNLGTLLSGHDQDSARVVMEAALVGYEENHGPESLVITSSLINLGLLEQQVGDLPRAASHFGRAARIRTQILGAANPRTAYALLGLANTQRQMQQYAESARNFRTAIDALRSVDAVPPPALRDFAEVLRVLGEAEEADRIEEEFSALTEGAPSNGN